MTEFPPLAIILSGLGVVLAILSFTRGIRNRDDDKLQAVREAGAAAREALEKQFNAKIESVQAVERQARHDLANTIDKVIISLRAEIKELDRTSVRKEDMKAQEDRMNARLDKIEVKLDRVLNRAIAAE